jgi:hypothetical protein
MTSVRIIRASLRVVGHDLVPGEITRLLGVVPTQAHAKGEPTDIGRGRTSPALTGVWALTAAPNDDLDVQVHQLLAATTADLATWRDVASRFRIDIFVGVVIVDGHEGFVLKPATLAALGERGIELDLDLYSAAEDDD